MLRNISGLTASYAVSAYNRSSAQKPERTLPQRKNTDVLTISESGDDFETRLSRKTADIADGVRAADDSKRAEQIAARIKNGSYSVPAADIARAILGIA
jgi:anti-sigma28 factor (negative regulator of flagellin synthesis)